jgi:hypothetical protein
MKYLTLTILLLLVSAAHASAQPARPVPPPAGADAVERTATAERQVVVSLCVNEGQVVVRGWDRGEVRARAEGGAGLRLQTPNVQPAPRVEVLLADEEGREPSPGGCGELRSLELSVPRGATVRMQVRDGHVDVSEVAEARVNVITGDVELRGVTRGAEVSCMDGDISLSDSKGHLRLRTVNGSVEAENVRAVESGDEFEASTTSGDVTIEGVNHAQVRGTSVSGAVFYSGALARGGLYDFKTISGDVTLSLPAEASFSLHARVITGGDIITDFPVRAADGAPAAPSSPGVSIPDPPDPPAPMRPVKNKPPKPPKGPRGPMQTRLDGTVGPDASAVLNLTSLSGTLHVKKQ